jgi:hypothetical protein
MIASAKQQISPVVISTALGHDGRGIFPYTLLPGYRRLLAAARKTGTTVCTKSATRFKRRGNFIPANPLTWKYIRRLPDMGMLNAYGLTNAGVEVCAPDIRRACDAGFKIIPNIYPEFIKGTAIAIQETLEAVSIYQRSLGPHFQALELNFSCPNSEEAIAKNVVQALQATRKVRSLYPRLFLIAKLSICHPYEFAQELERIGVNALHAVNTIPERGERRRRLRGAVIPPGLKVQSGIAAKSAPVVDHGLRGHVRRRRPALLRPRRRRSQPVHPGPPEASGRGRDRAQV